MKITDDLVKNKFVAGHTSEGKPIIFVETHGGLFACFSKSKSGGYETLATAPHKAILRWMCEKKEKGLQWSPEFTGEQPTHAQKFAQMREAMFSPDQVKKSESDSDDYMVYDVENKAFAIMDGEELEKSIKTKEIGRMCILRKSDCTEKPSFASVHPRFGRLYE